MNSFVIRGLSFLADYIFVSMARSIKVMNPAGVQKVKRNILSLQQCLRGLSKNQNDVLSRSMAYWDLYDAGPKVRGSGKVEN
jgi:exocyst complex component 4